MARISRLFQLLPAALLTLHAQTVSPVQDLYQIDRLPRLRPFAKVGSSSSYDRTGGNDDGFSGKYSFLRREGDALVLVDLKGPGVITRIHTPTPDDSPLEFFFDNEEKPRLVLPFRELFQGTHPPFLAPLAGSGGGGYFSYVPLTFEKACKIRLRAPKLQFYDINYALYEPGTRVKTFEADETASRAQAARVARTWQAPERALLPPTYKQERRSHVLPAHGTATLFESKQGGRVVAIRLTPASAFAGPDRRLLLRAVWDGDARPAIIAPVGDFFGFSFGSPSARSLLAGTAGDTCYAYFPMPFDRSARIEIVSERDAAQPVRFDSEVLWSSAVRRPDEGRFYALWHRENPTVAGQPFRFVETSGRGHLVGVMLQAQGAEPGQTTFFEGDDEATLDGELTIHGTGSEDFFNGGWYDVPGRWYGRLSFPLSGALDYDKPMGRTGGYRFMLSDAYAFRKSLRFTIEHGPEGNLVPTDYASVSYLYLQHPPTYDPGVPTAARRAVADPPRLVFVPGWNQAIYAFSLENMTLTKREVPVGERKHRVLSIEAHGDETFGPHYIAFSLKVPHTADYDVSLEGLAGPGRGTAQLLLNDVPVGAAARFAAAEPAAMGPLPMGTLRLQEGLNHVFFRLAAAGKPGEPFRLDLLRITLAARSGEGGK
jgi:hypothetical protein